MSHSDLNYISCDRCRFSFHNYTLTLFLTYHPLKAGRVGRPRIGSHRRPPASKCFKPTRPRDQPGRLDCTLLSTASTETTLDLVHLRVAQKRKSCGDIVNFEGRKSDRQKMPHWVDPIQIWCEVKRYAGVLRLIHSKICSRLLRDIIYHAHNGTRDNSRGMSSAAAGGIRQIAMGDVSPTALV